jgi:hypothetical protein
MVNTQGCHQTINITVGRKVTFHLKELSQKFLAETEGRKFHTVVEQFPLLQSRPQQSCRALRKFQISTKVD